MTFQACPGIAELRCIYTVADQRVENILHVYHGDTNPWTMAELDELFNGALLTWATDTVTGRLAPTVMLNAFQLTDLSTQNGPRYPGTDGMPIPGQDPGRIEAPVGLTMVLKLDTFERIHGGSGRWYAPNLGTSDYVGSKVTQECIDGWTYILTNLKDSISGFVPPRSLCVLSRRRGGVVRPTGVALPIKAIYAVNDNLATQNSRLPGHRSARRRHV